jgi:hypothetical protein
MRRVIKKQGTVFIVEYNDRYDGPILGMVQKFIKFIEPKECKQFVEMGLQYYIDAAKLKIVSREKCLFGVVQVVECKKK